MFTASGPAVLRSVESGGSAASPTGSGQTSSLGNGPGSGFVAVRVLEPVPVTPVAGHIIQVPDDTFRHSSQTGSFQLRATLADGSPLPDWVRFDATSGRVTLGQPSAGVQQLDIRITATDREGRSASTDLRLKIGR